MFDKREGVVIRESQCMFKKEGIKIFMVCVAEIGFDLFPLCWQELRKLVRGVHSVGHKDTGEDNKGETDAAVVGARRSLTCFLQALAKQISRVEL